MRNVVIAILLTAAIASAGQFKCGALRTSEDVAVLNIPHPPDALLKAKNLRMQWESVGGFQKADQLRQNIEQGLNKEFGFTDPSPDAIIKLSILSFEPVTEKRYSQNESRPIKVGEKPIYNKEGKQTGTQDIIENRVVPVEYWEGSGSIKINFSVMDKTGVPIDTFAPKARYHNKREISINGQSTLTPAPRLLFVRKPDAGASSLPTPASLEIMMMDQVANQVKRRYTATFDPVKVILGCDGELRAGNKLAVAGQWKEAQDTWTASNLKKNGADRTFNIAVATEASAYAEYARTQNIEDMLPLFTKAMDLYGQALTADPQEKYMREQRDRLTVAKTNIENVRKQYELQQAEARKAEEEARKVLEARMVEERRKTDLDAAIRDTSPDTPEEAKFRPVARIRIGATQGDVSQEQAQDLIGFGQRTYALNELRSYRVVWQEVERKKTIGQKLKDYEDTFKAFVADGKLTPDERLQLKDIQKTMALEDPEVRAAEAKFTFRDETKTASTPPLPRTPKPTTPKPAPTKPVTAAKPPATTAVKPTTGVTGATPVIGTSPTTPPAKPGIGGTDTKKDTKK